MLWYRVVPELSTNQHLGPSRLIMVIVGAIALCVVSCTSAPEQTATRAPSPSPFPTITPVPTLGPTAPVPNATPTAPLPPSPTMAPATTAKLVPLASPTSISVGAQTSSYKTKHGSVLPLIDTDELEDSLLSLINDLRLKENNESFVRVPALDEFAEADSRQMAASEQLDAEPLELSCGASGTEVIQWAQVKSFNYRGHKDAPSSTTPTEYEKTAEETASGIVEFMNEGRDSYIEDPHFKFVGVGVVQEPDELGFMDFWVTLHLTDCLDESSMVISTPTKTVAPSPAPTATATPSPTPTATPTPSPTPTPTATPSPKPTPSPLRIFQNGRWLMQEDPQLAASVEELGWIQDGLEGFETEAVENLLYIAFLSRPVASSIVSLGWVQDGVDGVEAEAIRWLENIKSADVASSVVSLGWVTDGFDALEVKTVEGLSYLTNRDAEAAMRIVGMPFVQTIEPPDISAIESLAQLAAFRTDTFVEVMDHSTVRVGISDNWAPIVATINGVAKTNPGLIDVLLDNSSVYLEQRTITLPLAGDVGLSIIRTGPGAARSMDLLEHSVRSAEEFMGAPLPTNFVGLLYADAVPGYSAGTNFGTHIAILPKYDVDDGSFEAERTGATIAHEVAHYYWSGNEDWVDEGAAELMASIIDGARTGHQVAVTRPPCAYAGNLRELENLGSSRGDAEFGCNYSLGERLFVGLYRTHGRGTFQRGFRDLYLASEIEDELEDNRGTSVGIEHVREAFRSGDGLENVVYARWYDGTQPYDLSRLDTGPVDPSLPTINGRIEMAYVSTSEDGPALTTFSAQDVSDWALLKLKYSYDVSSDHEVPLEIVEFYEDGFEFRRRGGKVTAAAGYIGSSWLFSVGQSPSRKWAPGRYWVYVYSGDQKIAEVSYEVTP